MAQFNLAEYDTVDSRIGKFWSSYPEGRILTEMVSDPNALDEVVFKASVYLTREDTLPVAVGWAFEKRGKSASDKANFTHHVENAETSSIGRALANLNFKTHKDAPRPSREEMEKIDRYAEDAAKKPSAGSNIPPFQIVTAEDAQREAQEPSDEELFAKCKAERDTYLVDGQKVNIWNVIGALTGTDPEVLRADAGVRHDALLAAAHKSADDWRTCVQYFCAKPDQPALMNGAAPTVDSNATLRAIQK